MTVVAGIARSLARGGERAQRLGREARRRSQVTLQDQIRQSGGRRHGSDRRRGIGHATPAPTSPWPTGAAATIARQLHADHVGTDQIDVRVSGVAVPGLAVHQRRRRRSSGPGADHRRRAGRPVRAALEIIVHVADAEGNPLGRGGDHVTVTIAGAISLSVEDRGDGTYRAVWVPFVTGKFDVGILLNGTPIKGKYDTHIRSSAEQVTRRRASTYLVAEGFTPLRPAAILPPHALVVKLVDTLS